jgi:hypothetical protein
VLASFHGDVWAGSIRPAASTAFSYQPVVPRSVGSGVSFVLLDTGSDRPSTSASHRSTSLRRYSVRMPALIVLGPRSLCRQ